MRISNPVRRKIYSKLVIRIKLEMFYPEKKNKLIYKVVFYKTSNLSKSLINIYGKL